MAGYEYEREYKSMHDYYDELEDAYFANFRDVEEERKRDIKGRWTNVRLKRERRIINELRAKKESVGLTKEENETLEKFDRESEIPF